MFTVSVADNDPEQPFESTVKSTVPLPEAPQLTVMLLVPAPLTIDPPLTVQV